MEKSKPLQVDKQGPAWQLGNPPVLRLTPDARCLSWPCHDSSPTHPQVPTYLHRYPPPRVVVNGGDGLRGYNYRWTETLKLGSLQVTSNGPTCPARRLVLSQGRTRDLGNAVSPHGNLTWREAGTGSPAAVQVHCQRTADDASTCFHRHSVHGHGIAVISRGPGNSAGIIPSLWGRTGRNGTPSEPSEFEHVRARPYRPAVFHE